MPRTTDPKPHAHCVSIEEASDLAQALAEPGAVPRAGGVSRESRSRPVRRPWTNRGRPRVRVGARLMVCAALSGLAALALPASAAFAVDSGLTQLPGRSGCVGDQGCASGRALEGARAVAVSPEGRSVYVASVTGVAVLARNQRTDRVAQLAGRAGCVGATRSSCAGARGLAGSSVGALGVVVSPDGRNVYVAGNSALAVFSREPRAGKLTQLAGPAGCITDSGGGSAADGCASARALGAPWSLAISRDGRNVYVGARASDAVAAFARDPTTGALTQLPGAQGCVSESMGGSCALGRALANARGLAISPDDRNVYAAGRDAIAVLARDPATGTLAQPADRSGCVSSAPAGAPGCLAAPALFGVESLALDAAGGSLYAASFGNAAGGVTNALSRFARDPRTGTLDTPAGPAACIGPEGPCTPGRALFGASGVAASPDGQAVYVASRGLVDDTSAGPEVRIPGAVAVFAADPASGALEQLQGRRGCLSTKANVALAQRNDRTGCARARQLEGATGIAVSPDGEAVYVAASESNALAVFIRPLLAVSARRAQPNKARVAVRCLATTPAKRCSGRLTLYSARRLRLGRRKARPLRLGSRRFSIPAGQRRILTVAVRRDACRLLCRTRRHRLAAEASVTAASPGRHTRTVTTRLLLRVDP